MLIIYFIVLISCGLATSNQYKGYKVYDVNVNEKNNVPYLQELTDNTGFDNLIITNVPNTHAQVMVAPTFQKSFENELRTHKLDYNIIVSDVEKKLISDNIEKQRVTDVNRLNFSEYYRHNVINAYLDTLANEYPKYVRVRTLVKTYEGRPLRAITITNGDNDRNKSVIIIDAGIHAREWLGPAAALYVMHQLVPKMFNSDLLKHFDWIIVPVANPDGYEYSHTNDRFWRKTRTPNFDQFLSEDTTCKGTDLNRNFDHVWGQYGSSVKPCSNTYQGSKPFSEAEACAIRDLLLDHKGRTKLYLTLHSFGRFILYPWGHTKDLPSSWKELNKIAKHGAEAMLKQFGEKWSYGSSCRLMYAASGSSEDYAYYMKAAPISFTMELQGGGSGFDPNPSQILEFVHEAWVGIKAMIEKVDSMYHQQ